VKTGYWLMQVVRGGPLTPARLRVLDHAPDDPPWNKLDRGNLSHVLCADVGGEPVPPEIITDRFLSPTDWRSHKLPSHWKFMQPISEREFSFRVAEIRWAKEHAPREAIAEPRQTIDLFQTPPPFFLR
jgi:hypothetical protein